VNSNFPFYSRELVKEVFQDPALLTAIWNHRWGVRNSVDQLRQVLMHRPGNEVLKLHEHGEHIESDPLLLDQIKGRKTQNGSSSKPELSRLRSQHDALVAALKKEQIHVELMEHPTELWPERIFTRDVGMVIPGGVILTRLALYVRYGETMLASQAFSRIGIPILGTIQGNGFAEGGSFTMLDDRTAIIGRSERVNPEGIQQVRQILSIQNIELITIDLPASIIHLDEAFLMIDYQKALVNIALLPFWFLDELNKRKIEMFHVDPRDPALAINALTISPGRVMCSADSKYTMELLAHHGIEVIPVDISEIQKMGGGIHCCTLALLRESM
jgi:N-dimethylarginine dimethylaminohydrolase